MSKDNSGKQGGIGFIGLLTIAFVVLKLTQVISWSWFWVLSPLWIVAGLVVLVIIASILLALKGE